MYLVFVCCLFVLALYVMPACECSSHFDLSLLRLCTHIPNSRCVVYVYIFILSVSYGEDLKKKIRPTDLIKSVHVPG